MNKLCPKCNSIMNENSYFKKYMCNNCNYTENIEHNNLGGIMNKMNNKDSNNNLIYIVYDRSFRFATFDFKTALNNAEDSNLVVYDLEDKGTLLDFYCSCYSIRDLEDELLESNLINTIPDCQQHIDDLKNYYEKMNKEREERNRKRQEEQDYKTYLRVKERLEQEKLQNKYDE